MAKEQFEQARKATRDFLVARNIENHMFHGPVSDRYWTQRFRLVAVNMESYGYDGRHEVNREYLIDWMNDAGKTGTRTVRRTLAILTVLNRRLLHGEKASWGGLHAAYADETMLEDTLDSTVYYNIRPESNPNKKQDFAAIVAVGSSNIGPLLWSELCAFDPHVMLISGQAGLAALSGIASLTPPLSFRGMMVHPEGFIIQSIEHPSRPRYNQWAVMVEDVAKKIEHA